MIKLKELVIEKKLIDGFNKLIIHLNEYIGHIKPNSPIKFYLKKYKKLNQSEENKLIKKYQTKKDSKAFDALIRSYSKYMIKMIMKNKSKFERVDFNVTTEEVFNAMIINFAKAINKFDPNKGYKFITYLDKWLYEVVRNYKHFITKSAKIIGDKSHSTDLTIGKSGEKSTTIGDLIKDPTKLDMYKEKEKSDFMKKLSKDGFKKLTDNEQFIIKAKYGFLDADEEDKVLSKMGKVTNNSIGDYLGFTAPGIRKAHKRALVKLRKAMK